MNRRTCGAPPASAPVKTDRALTMMSAVTVAPPRPATRADVDAWIVTCPAAAEFVAGVKRRPAAPSAIVMNAPLAIGVTPSCWNSVPPVMFVTRTCVTSLPSAGLRLTTRPDAVCVLRAVEALVIDGVSATAETATVKVRVIVLTPPNAVPPLSCTVTVITAVPLAPATGV